LRIPLKEGLGGERRPKDRVTLRLISLLSQVPTNQTGTPKLVDTSGDTSVDIKRRPIHIICYYTRPTVGMLAAPVSSTTTRGVSHYGLAILLLKKYLKAKEELWKLKYFIMQK
jgi:hypothetical protein